MPTASDSTSRGFTDVTLMPGDMILTGTPHGVHFCAAGDEVVCEIEGIGRLVHHLVPS